MNNQSGTKCDVWSLGVLLWETVTLGGTPFSTVATKEVAMRVARGMRLPRVPGLSDQLYQVPNIRQTFYEEAPGTSITFCFLCDEMISDINFFGSSCWLAG